MGKRRMRANGEGSVYRVGGHRRLHWCATVVVGWRPDGTPLRKARYANTRTEALARLGELQRERDLGLKGGNATVAEYLERWRASADVRARTRVNYEGAVRLYLVPLLGHRKLSALTPGEIREAIAGIDRSAKTRANILGTLRSALGQAVRDGILERNVAALVTAPKGTVRAATTLTAEQARTLIESVRGDRLFALYLLALHSGMRQGELLGCLWSDVDGLDIAGTAAPVRIHVRRALARIDGEYVRVPTKSVASQREILLGPSVMEALRRHRAGQRREQLAAGPAWRDRGLVFTRPDGEALNSRVVTLAFQGHLAKAGLPKATFHSTRHFAATTLVAQSGDLKMAQAVLGHANIGVTADVYSHVVEAQLQRAADVMEGILGAAAISTAI
jgi:integrase